MNFAELRFWGLLAAGLVSVLVVRYVLAALGARRPAFDRAALAAIGLMLLLAVSWVTFAIYLAVLLITYGGLRWIVRHHERHAARWLSALLVLQFTPLLFFKYGGFVASHLVSGGGAELPRLLIPVGISFYTFQMAGFAVDTLAFKHPLPRFLDWMNFAGFFPQLVAGPIERRAELLPQIQRFQFRWTPRDLNEGITWVAIGLFFKCCLADNLAAGFLQAPPDNPFLIWLANILFGLRIYYDFAGYSLIAYGLGRGLGVRLTMNFQSPYCATSIGEFWRRWHITLSQWFRDYVYVPLGGGRAPRWAVNIAIVFVVSGLWHGAGWNFILWGAMHGIFLIASRVVRRRLPPLAGWILTMISVFFAWLAFYEPRFPLLLAKMGTLLDPFAYSASALRAALALSSSGNLILVAGVLLLAALVLIVEWLSARRTGEAYAYLRRPEALAIIVALTIWLSPGMNNGFIYFAF